MKQALISLLVLAATTSVVAQTADFFTPYKTTKLRLPAVPLIVSDPYLSIWSPYNCLNEGTTKHWTDTEKSIEGLLRVDGKVYQFMGSSDKQILTSVVPMADEEAWTGAFVREKPNDGWQAQNFDDSKWQHSAAAFGTNNIESVRTPWAQEHSDIYVRRKVNLTSDDLKNDLYLVFSHDDAMEIYINGTLVGKGRMDLVEGERVHLIGDLKKLLCKGENIIAAHCYNNVGFALVDFGICKNALTQDYPIVNAVQKSVSVMATSSYYTFACGPVELNVVFTAPDIIDNYDLLSSPANYISYKVKSTDKKAHNVQFYIGTSPQLAVNKENQPTVSQYTRSNGVKYIKSGTIEQPILATKGDGVCIDWGYLYMPDINGTISIDNQQNTMDAFIYKGTLPVGENKVVSRKASEMPTLAYVHDFGKTIEAQSFTLLGYDEIQDIEYMYHRYKAYWAHSGKVSITDMFDRLVKDYTSIMTQCRALDKRIYDDGVKAGDIKYAEILSGSYRQVIAAHKLFKDNEGNLLFFSKENNSNGCVNTVDLTYPSSSLFLAYNPDLQKGMMTSIFNVCYDGRWIKPFPPHDLGTYPIANGQVYGGDMPLEEGGNMMILAAMISKLEGNTNYVNKYWDILTTWVNYLADNGQDPSNQLCTDDFAGHWAHNTNLSVKAIMGVAGYAQMAALKGDRDAADKYMKIAANMAQKWEDMADDGNHYRLAFDRTDTWSQKYNMVWDKIWGTNLFKNNAMGREISYYLSKQNQYGLPLDSRKDYTKSDWIMWTATMAGDNNTFLKFIYPVYDYVNTTQSRMPLSDWHDTKTGLQVGFKARSVIGGYWMKVLTDKVLGK